MANQTTFGYKMRTGAGVGLDLVRTVELMPTNDSGIAAAHKSVRGGDRFCYGDFDYTDIEYRWGLGLELWLAT